MTLRDTTHLLRRLNPHCAKALEAAANLCQGRLSDEITVEHWLLKLIEAGDGDVPAILRHYGIDVDALWDALLAEIERLPRNLRGKPALSLQMATVLQDAWLRAAESSLTQVQQTPTKPPFDRAICYRPSSIRRTCCVRRMPGRCCP